MFGLYLLSMCLVLSKVTCLITDEEAAKRFLEEYERVAAPKYTHSVTASWNYYTDINDQNLERMVIVYM